MGAGLSQHGGGIARGKSQREHPGAAGSANAEDRIFDYGSGVGTDPEPIGGEQEEVWGGFAALDLGGAADCSEETFQTDVVQREVDFLHASRGGDRQGDTPGAKCGKSFTQIWKAL